MLMGRDVPINTPEEAFMIQALIQNSYIEIFKTMSVVNAIILGANGIISALSDGEATPNDSKLKNVLRYLKEMMLPHLREESDKKAAKAKKILEEEQNKVYKVEKMSQSNAAKRRGRIKTRKREES